METQMIGTEAERSVIGAILIDQRAFRFIESTLTPEDFSAVQLELIYAGIVRMVGAQQPIDVITVADRLAEWQVRGLTAADLNTWTSQTPHTAGAGMWADIVRADSLRRQIRVAGQRVLQGIESAESPPSEVLARHINELQAIQQHTIGEGLQAKTLAEVLATTDRYDWVIPDLLERKDRLILTGGEGAGKSTFVRQIAIAAAAGVHPISGQKIKPVNALVIDAENSEQQWRRSSERIVREARKAGSVDPAQTVHLVCAPRLDLTRDAHLGQVHKLLDKYKPDILFIGPLYRLTPRAIMNDDDAAPLLAALDTVRDRSVAMVMEAHAGHALGMGGERDLRPRGSAALMGWPEFGKGIRVDREFPDFYNLVSWRGDRESRNWPERMRRGAEGEFPWVNVPVYPN
jgi:hypothetical protein